MSGSTPPTATRPEAVATETEQALDGLGIVVGEIAHDFNNILSLIFGYVEMALSEIPEGQRARSDLEHVLAAGDRAKELVARILTYSNRAKLKKTPINLDVPVARALKFLKDRLPPQVNLVGTLPDQPLPVVGNETEIHQLVLNLCNNSVQALGEASGDISVTLRRIEPDSAFFDTHGNIPRQPYALLTITDNGCGMDLSTQEKMYTPFFTTSRQHGRQESRAGLGLTTVYNIVSSQNGYILVASAPGEGTTFDVCLPLAGEPATGERPAPQGTPAERPPKRVLFVDDEPAITEMTSHILAHSGYQAMFFNDGNEAYRYFEQHPYDFDIIVTDLIMPVLSGSELASRCIALNPNIPIILTTGFSEKISLANCRQWGVTAVITKPFAIGQLLATLEELTKS